MEGKPAMRQRLFWGLSLNFKLLIILSLIFTAICSGVGFAEEMRNTWIEIIADPPEGQAPMKVHLEPKLVNLRTPATFKWSFGDGEESAKMVPGWHLFKGGKYNVTLEVVDTIGKKYTASVTINAALPG